MHYEFDPTDHPEEWSVDYSQRDIEICDYQFYELTRRGVKFRGPRVPPADLSSGNYFSCLGAAQTVGCYVERPWPDLLAEKLGLPALNLAVGGCGPGFYLMNPELIDIVNRGRFAVLQVMTARTEGNARLAPYGFVDALKDANTGEVLQSSVAWGRLHEDEREHLPEYVAQSLANWQQRNQDLIERITVPIILFYFAFKPLDEPVNYKADDIMELLLPFPQFVERASVDAVRANCDSYVECTSQRNFGHPLVSRHTGEPVTVDHGIVNPQLAGLTHDTNHYYPSPEMHQDAAAVMEDAVKELATGKPEILPAG